VGIALTLQHLLEFGGTLSELKNVMPKYFIAKKKADLVNIKPDEVLEKLAGSFKDCKINREDGLKVDFEDHWVHFRKSNTEPIIRIVTEARTLERAETLSNEYFMKIKSLF
jgi:phosphomannomutase